MLIKVTQMCISHGVKGTCTRCPVGIAIRHLLKPGWYAKIGKSVIILKEYGVDEEIGRETPETVREFVEMFDAGEGVAPFEFELDIPERILE